MTNIKSVTNVFLSGHMLCSTEFQDKHETLHLVLPGTYIHETRNSVILSSQNNSFIIIVVIRNDECHVKSRKIIRYSRRLRSSLVTGLSQTSHSIGKGKDIAVRNRNNLTTTGIRHHTVLPATRQRGLSRLYPSQSW